MLMMPAVNSSCRATFVRTHISTVPLPVGWRYRVDRPETSLIYCGNFSGCLISRSAMRMGVTQYWFPYSRRGA